MQLNHHFFSFTFYSILIFIGLRLVHAAPPKKSLVTYLGAKEKLWSDAAKAHGFVMTGGALGQVDGEIVKGGIKNQTTYAIKNLGRFFEEGGTSWDNVLKVNIFLADIKDWPAMNEVYERLVPFPKPGRTTVQAKLSGDFVIEIEAIAAIPNW